MRKHKHYKIMCFLNISREAKIHKILKTLEKWIPLVRESMGKQKHFEIKCFLSFSPEAEIHAVLKTWGKMGKHKHFRFMGFLNISGEAEIHKISKIREKWIPIIWEKYAKKQTFQTYGFLKYFGWSRNPCNFQNMVKWFIVQQKYEKTQTFQIYGFLRYFRLIRNP